jgi:hypothetical protein
VRVQGVGTHKYYRRARHVGELVNLEMRNEHENFPCRSILCAPIASLHAAPS